MTIDLLYTAMRMVTESPFHGSPSMLCRRIRQEHGVRITFDTARNLLAQMQDAGIVGPETPAHDHPVLMDRDQAVKALNKKWGGDWTGNQRELWGLRHLPTGDVTPFPEAVARGLAVCNEDRQLVTRETVDSPWITVSQDRATKEPRR